MIRACLAGSIHFIEPTRAESAGGEVSWGASLAVSHIATHTLAVIGRVEGVAGQARFASLVECAVRASGRASRIEHA